MKCRTKRALTAFLLCDLLLLAFALLLFFTRLNAGASRLYPTWVEVPASYSLELPDNVQLEALSHEYLPPEKGEESKYLTEQFIPAVEENGEKTAGHYVKFHYRTTKELERPSDTSWSIEDYFILFRPKGSEVWYSIWRNTYLGVPSYYDYVGAEATFDCAFPPGLLSAEGDYRFGFHNLGTISIPKEWLEV